MDCVLNLVWIKLINGYQQHLFRAIDISELEKIIQLELKNINPIIPDSIHTTFVTEGLTDCVKHIQICEIENVQEDIQQMLNEVPMVVW